MQSSNIINSSDHNSIGDHTENRWSPEDIEAMHSALKLANDAAQLQEVPVGAVLVHDHKVIGSGFNQPIRHCDPTAHAEIVALRNACLAINNYRLPKNTTLYVTLEPCTMCIGALIHARVTKIIYAATEPRAGMLGSQINLAEHSFYNHQIAVASGLLADQSRRMLKEFFKQRRATRS